MSIQEAHRSSFLYLQMTMAPGLPFQKQIEGLFSEETKPAKLGNRWVTELAEYGREVSMGGKTGLGKTIKHEYPALFTSSQNASGYTYIHQRNWLALEKRSKETDLCEAPGKTPDHCISLQRGPGWEPSAHSVSNKGLPEENLKSIIKSPKRWLALYYLFFMHNRAAILNKLSDKILPT